MNISPYVVPGLKREYVMPMPVAEQKIDTIKQIVCLYFKLNQSELDKRSPSKTVKKVRNIIWHLVKDAFPEMLYDDMVRQTTKVKYTHGTVSLALKRIQTDPDLQVINNLYFK